MQQMLQSNGSLQDSARQRLIEFGMTEAQIAALDKAGEANSRLHVCAPISGTVIEKLAAEGDYVKEGQPIYRLADLSTVWLMLELFPDDAATICYGQKVGGHCPITARAKLHRSRGLYRPHGRSEDTYGRCPRGHTQSTRPTARGGLRQGDDQRSVAATRMNGVSQLFDPDLAGKWISPRHPHIVRSAPGVCPLCGVDLVPAAQYRLHGQCRSEPIDAGRST